ncbi:nascent polypeptide-associated complex protein [Candidatus Woesearchaeota archaeon]|nr:nascent polypeptide-associated complex protein [Candidatus Woesearchaeota archaeon]
MLPGMNPRMMKQAMKKLGMEQEEIEASEVIIKTAGKELVFSNPEVSKVTVMGQETWQIVGTPQERGFSKEDVRTVMEQAQVSEEKAAEALADTQDIAEAIMKLKAKSL